MTELFRRACIGAFVICNTAFPAISPEIRNVFSAEAGRHSFLGNPTDSIAANENGYQQDFESGAIFYLDSAFEAHGLILGKFRQLCGPWGYLGFPLSDELSCKDGSGRYSNFQNGAVYYNPLYGTHQVMGAMLSRWRSLGADTGAMGYPIADPIVCDTGMIQQFQHGLLSIKCRVVDMREHMVTLGMRVRNQSWRGTCSVFAMTCLLEYAYAQLLGGEYVDLSEEYMNHVANLASGQTDDGSCFEPVAEGYESYGVVPESSLPYDLGKAYDFATFNLPESTITKGRSLLTTPLKLKEMVIKPGCPLPSSMGLSSGQMDSIFIELNKGYPIAVGRGHSLVIAGYVTDATMPGGGFFIIRNSYGPDADDHGYRYETIEHLKTTVYDVYGYEMPAGVVFSKVLRGRVLDKNGAGIANSRVEISGATSPYGSFTRYDSTDETGSYRIQKIISIASTITATASGGFGLITKQTALNADTTVLDLGLKSTSIETRQASLAQFSAITYTKSDRRVIRIAFPYPLESRGSLEIYGLDGKSILAEYLPKGAATINVPFDGGRHSVLLYSVTAGKPAVTKRGVVRFQR